MNKDTLDVMKFIIKETEFGNDCILVYRTHKETHKMGDRSEYQYQGNLLATSFTYSQLESALTWYEYEKREGKESSLPQALFELFELLGSVGKKTQFISDFYEKFEKEFNRNTHFKDRSTK